MPNRGESDQDATITRADRVHTPPAGRPPDTESRIRQTAGVWRRLRNTRGFTVFAFLVIGAVLLACLTAWQAVLQGRAADIGLSIESDSSVEGVDARWPGVRSGDRLVSLDGTPLRGVRDWATRVRSLSPGPVEVGFERNGVTWSQRARAEPVRSANLVALWARIVTGSLMMAIGLLAFISRPGALHTWLLLGVSWLLGAMLLSKVLLAQVPDVYWPLGTALLILALGVDFHFLAAFPRKMSWLTPTAAAALYVPTAFGLAVLAAMLIAPGTPLLPRRIGTVNGLASATGALGSVWLLVLQHRRIQRERQLQEIPRYRALVVAFLLGMIAPALWNTARKALDIGLSPWSAHYNAVPLLAFVAVVAYAAVRHNALEVDRFTAAIVGYGISLAVVAASLGGVLLALSWLIGHGETGRSPLVLVLLTAVAMLVFAPLYRRVKRQVDRRFFRSPAGSTELSEALKALALAQSETPGRALGAALDAALVLPCERADLWLLGGDGSTFLPSLSRGESSRPGPAQEIDLAGPLGQEIASGEPGGVESLAPRQLSPEAQDELWERGLAFAVPVSTQGSVLGFLGMTRKRSGEAFSPDDVSYLSAIAAQLSVMLDLERGDRIFVGKRFRVERRLGVGGMAEVLLVRQLGPSGFERRVALKRPLPSALEEPQATRAFLDEARIVAQLVHRNIAQIYEVGEEDGVPFLAMEYVDGPSVRALIHASNERKERIPLSIATAITSAVLDALCYIHTKTDERGRPLGLVHRDIKPANVLINSGGEVKVVDFGIARAFDRVTNTRAGTVKGTLCYMPADQALQGAARPELDLYATGVLFYELLTGHRAFPDGPRPRAPKRVSEIEPRLGTALDRVLEKSFAFAPEQRFHSAEEQLHAIEAAILPEIPASPKQIAEWVQRVPRPTRRSAL